MSESNEGQLQDYSIDQVAGAIVLVLGAVASLLLVLWQSKCLCKVNLCYIFQCERRPPSEEEMEGLKQQTEKLKNKKETLIPPKNKKPPAKPEPTAEPDREANEPDSDHESEPAFEDANDVENPTL